MTSPLLQPGACAAAGLLLAACVGLSDIQQTPAVMRLQFSGASQPVAACIHRRVGGKLRQEPGGVYVIYDSVKGQHAQGLTHYAITVGERGANRGFAEWRVLGSATSRRGGARGVAAGITETAVREYWKPVEECAAAAKSP